MYTYIYVYIYILFHFIAKPLPPPMVRDVTVRVVINITIKGSTLNIQWSPLADCDSSITYTVWYSTSSGTITEPPSGASTVEGITGTSTTLSGLKQGTRYYIWVAAVSSDDAQGKFSIRISGLPYNGKFV